MLRHFRSWALLRSLLRGVARGLSLGFASGCLFAQPLAFRYFTDKDGVPQSQIVSLLEDRDGFIWIGTQGSMARLGPSGIKTYGRGQGLNTTQVQAMIQDRHGSIWAADLEKGVFEIRGSQIRNYGPKEGIVRPEAYSLLEGEDGSIYVGSRLGLFQKKPGQSFQEVELPDQWKHSPIYAMAQDPNHRGIWLGSFGGRLTLWDGHHATQALLPASFSRSFFCGFQKDPQGRLVALLDTGLIRLEGDAWVRLPLEGVQETMRFEAFSVDAKGEILIAMGSDGIYQLLPNGRHHLLTRKDGLPRESIRVALRDRHGVMWVGTDGAYLAAQVLPGLRTIQNDPETGQSLAMGAVMGFLELSPGKILMASSGGGLLLWEDGRGIVGHWMTKDGLPTDDCWALGPAPKGGAWVGTTKGIALWRNGVITKGPKEL
jgi:ligand-binding sensor domain-containing protein